MTRLNAGIERRSGRAVRFRVARGIAIAGLWIVPSAVAVGGGLQQRIDAAEPGAVLRVEAGLYEGAVSIGKPLTLLGIDRPIIDGEGVGHVVRIEAPDVRIEGFVVRNSGANLSKDHAGILIEGDRATVANNRIENALHGVYLRKADGAVVTGNRVLGKRQRLIPVEDALTQGLRLTPDGEMCIVDLGSNQRGNGIHLWNSTGNRLENNEISDTRDGIYFSFSDRTLVRDNYVHHVRYGLHYMYSDENVFENNRFEQNAAGAAIMYSKGLLVRRNTFTNNRGRRAYGLLLNAVDDTTFLGNELRRNTVGIYVENSNNNFFAENEIGTNYIGVRFSASSQNNAFTRNVFARNLHSVELDRDSGDNQWTPDGVGNFWANARAVDLDGDGTGEFAHRESDLLGGFRRELPMAGLLTGTPALQLIDFVQSRVPLPGVSAITDSAPLVQAPAGSLRD